VPNVGVAVPNVGADVGAVVGRLAGAATTGATVTVRVTIICLGADADFEVLAPDEWLAVAFGDGLGAGRIACTAGGSVS
jgi:hypothetical protein